MRTISRGEDHLLRADASNGTKSSLHVLEHQLGRHIMGLLKDSVNKCSRSGAGWIYTYLVHEPEHDFVVGGEPRSKGCPEVAEVRGSRRLGVCSVSNDRSGRGLVRRIVVPHVVVGVNEGVGSGVGNSLDRGLVLREML